MFDLCRNEGRINLHEIFHIETRIKVITIIVHFETGAYNKRAK